MPQMAPINWIFLFIIFCLTYLMFNIMNYYLYTPKMKTSKNNTITKTEMYWKW